MSTSSALQRSMAKAIPNITGSKRPLATAGSELIHFDPNHHPTVRARYAERMDLWKHQCNPSKEQPRCSLCWLPVTDCYCSTLNRAKSDLSSSSSVLPNTKLLFYYHIANFGSCSNTGHLMERLLPDMTEGMVFGDVERENQLIDDIYKEHEDNEPVTCLLYPAPDAMLLSDWVKQRPNKSLPIRLVALDGTYPEAKRQYRHITFRCQLRQCSVPVVKLNLEGMVCPSIIGAIKAQPSGDRLCTYQAAVMALRELEMDSSTCDKLDEALVEWEQYMKAYFLKHGHVKAIDYKKSAFLNDP